MTSDGYALVLHGDADASKLGGTAVCGFSSTGMVGVIAASHMIRAWDLEQMGTVLDENFPAMALVQVVGLVEDDAKVEIETTAVVPEDGT